MILKGYEKKMKKSRNFRGGSLRARSAYMKREQKKRIEGVAEKNRERECEVHCFG